MTGGTSSRPLRLICKEPELRDPRPQPEMTPSSLGRGCEWGCPYHGEQRASQRRDGHRLVLPGGVFGIHSHHVQLVPGVSPQADLQGRTQSPWQGAAGPSAGGSLGRARLSPFSAAPGAPRSHRPPSARSSGRPCPAGSLGDTAGSVHAQAAPSQKQKKGSPPTPKHKGGFLRCALSEKGGGTPSLAARRAEPPSPAPSYHQVSSWGSQLRTPQRSHGPLL